MPLNINWQQILLHMLNLVILTGGLYLLLYKPVKQFMAKRTAHYAALEADAQEKLRSAEAMQAQYQEQLDHAQEELSREREAARQTMQRTVQQKLNDADAKAAAIVEEARQDAASQQEKTMLETRKALRDLAVAAAGKLAMQSDEDAFDQFLDAAARGLNHDQNH